MVLRWRQERGKGEERGSNGVRRPSAAPTPRLRDSKPVSEGGCKSPGQGMCTRKSMFIVCQGASWHGQEASLPAPLRRYSTPDPRLQTTWLVLLPVHYFIADESIVLSRVPSSTPAEEQFIPFDPRLFPASHSLAFPDNTPF